MYCVNPLWVHVVDFNNLFSTVGINRFFPPSLLLLVFFYFSLKIVYKARRVPNSIILLPLHKLNPRDYGDNKLFAIAGKPVPQCILLKLSVLSYTYTRPPARTRTRSAIIITLLVYASAKKCTNFTIPTVFHKNHSLSPSLMKRRV